MQQAAIASTVQDRVIGTIYGAILNDHHSLASMGDALDAAPYKGRPRAPVLYIKPRNTLNTGSVVTLPSYANSLEVGATLGVMIGMDATRVDAARAADVIHGYLVVADLSVPHTSYYRPAIREKCFDGSCVVAPKLVRADQVHSVDKLIVRTLINEKEVHALPLTDLVRGVPQLIADVTAFMTLRRGDVLLVGVPWNAPQVTAGDQVQVRIDGVGQILFGIDASQERISG